MGESTAIIVFDGTCVVCNGWVDFLLRHDARGRYRFAAMQGTNGRALLAAHGLDPDDPSSFLLLDEAGAHRDTDAIVRVAVRRRQRMTPVPPTIVAAAVRRTTTTAATIPMGTSVRLRAALITASSSAGGMSAAGM